MHNPEAGDDENQCQQSLVGEHTHEALPYFAHALPFAGGVGRVVEQHHCKQGNERHCSREIVDGDICLLTYGVAQRVDYRLAGESTHIHHHIEYGVAAGAVFACGFFGYRA